MLHAVNVLLIGVATSKQLRVRRLQDINDNRNCLDGDKYWRRCAHRRAHQIHNRRLPNPALEIGLKIPEISIY
jgi:hypothetical protein